MAIGKREQFLRDRAVRALGNHQVTEAVAKVKAIIGPANIPDSEPLAQSALDKLHQGETPTVEELTALEIVVRLLRPVVFSRNGALADLPDQGGHNLYPAELKDSWSAFRDLVKPLVPSIGRVEDRKFKHVGTGFLVADGVLATNRHVLGVLSFGAEVLTPGAARVVFKQEIDSSNDRVDIVSIDGVAAVHPKLDMVLLTVAKLGRPAVEMDPAGATETTKVVAIGYPGKDPVNNPLFLSGVFGNDFGVKRAALGEVLDGTETPSLFHDCSTTQGNSGSPIFSMSSGKVAGIHRAGHFMYRNEAVDAQELRKFVQSAQP
ncbi:MAG: serine protease Do [Alphaproteobacteria bacterium]|jgi:S1-C subfamily serine protease|nr:serine protease Do [Alphaproteobacteria bacterium]